jgi:hypothetical protein
METYHIKGHILQATPYTTPLSRGVYYPMLRPWQVAKNEENTTQEQEGGDEHQDSTGPTIRVIQQEETHADDHKHNDIEQECGHVVV